MPPIVVCTVNGKCLPVLAASIRAYSPGHELLVSKGPLRTFGEAYNDAMDSAFKDHDEILIANDDIVLTPTTMAVLMADVEKLKSQHGDKLGFVGTMADNVRWDQSIRFEHPHEVREVKAISPLLAWVSKRAFQAARFPPLNWYSDDVICEALNMQGFKHFVSTAYVHHAGSQTIGHDSDRLIEDAVPWLRANEPELLKAWLPHLVLNKPKICVYAIAKDEEKFVERFWNSASEADLVLIADTGSTDRTVEIANKLFGTQVHQICISPWRFDTARNAALSLVPADMDICISLDMDEVLESGWREEVERLWTEGVTRLRYGFDCGDDYVIQHEKIHSRIGYVWKHMCHEYPVADRIEEKFAVTSKVLATHKPDITKSRGQYLHMLFAAAADDPQSSRYSFYYARELSFTQRWDHSLAEFGRFLGLPGSTWNKERCFAMRTMAQCCAKLNRMDEALQWARKAVIEDPGVREPWYELAVQAKAAGRWSECLGAAATALTITERDVTFVNNPAVWGPDLQQLKDEALGNLKIQA
jgi:glycosyltransferase involved in cell wall biosynthesis